MPHAFQRLSAGQEQHNIFGSPAYIALERHPINILSRKTIAIAVKMAEKYAFEHIVLFWQFVSSLSPRITGSPARRQACSEPKAKLRAFTVYKGSDEVLINPAEVTNFHAVFSNSRAFKALSEVTKRRSDEDGADSLSSAAPDTMQRCASTMLPCSDNYTARPSSGGPGMTC
jgi:hypothetical protein